MLHHRGAYLCALGNVLAFKHFDANTRYLWTLPMFHCNGWCYPYTIAAVGGTNVCLRQVNAESIAAAFRDHDVTHLCGAPIVLRLATEAMKGGHSGQQVRMMVAAAPPPPATLRDATEAGLEVTHVYGLTEVYGPSALCEWKPEWDGLGNDAMAMMLSRQGVEYATCTSLDVVYRDTNIPVQRDGETMGEVVFHGNMVMKGYFKNADATDKALEGGYFRTGDLGVMHADNYLSIRDRAKDIVITGGENVSSIEVEAALVEHPEIHEAAVVPRPDPKWGEHPCAYWQIRHISDATMSQVPSSNSSLARGSPRLTSFDTLAQPSPATKFQRRYYLARFPGHQLVRSKNLFSVSASSYSTLCNSCPPLVRILTWVVPDRESAASTKFRIRRVAGGFVVA